MIVLDTNVVSELVRPSPNRSVVEWVDEHDSSELVITALTAAELRAGVALLPEGRRKDELGMRIESLLVETFAGYVLAFRCGLLCLLRGGPRCPHPRWPPDHHFRCTDRCGLPPVRLSLGDKEHHRLHRHRHTAGQPVGPHDLKL